MTAARDWVAELPADARARLATLPPDARRAVEGLPEGARSGAILAYPHPDRDRTIRLAREAEERRRAETLRKHREELCRRALAGGEGTGVRDAARVIVNDSIARRALDGAFGDDVRAIAKELIGTGEVTREIAAKVAVRARSTSRVPIDDLPPTVVQRIVDAARDAQKAKRGGK